MQNTILLNIIQYAILAIIPIIIINKTMQNYVPEADEEKSNIEITFEVLLQTLVMFIALFFINRIVCYIPTYSGSKYPDFKIIYLF